jgi:benzylsuccinate synthase
LPYRAACVHPFIVNRTVFNIPDPIHTEETGKEVRQMATCKECRCFFASKETPEKGDCVHRVVDPRQAYYKARPVDAQQDAASCDSFQKK